jgi:hypothetical protein
LKPPSPTCKSILTLLNNVNELIVKSSDRQGARDVMKAVKVYADNNKFEIPQDRLDSFHAILIDSTPLTLTNLIKDIAQSVMIFDKKKS